MANKVSSSNRPFGALLVVIALVGVAVLGYLASRPTQVISLDGTLPPMAAAGFVKGDPNAPVQIIEFGDFECPGCTQFAVVTEPDVMAKLVATGEVSFRFMDFPLTDTRTNFHMNAVAAHNAAHCSAEQGKFWEMHDRLFAGQFEWNSQATNKPKGVFEGYAQAIGLDVSKWSECYDSGKMLAQINANRNEGSRIGVRSTPTFIVGNQMYADGLSYDELRSAVLQAKVNTAMTQPGDRVPVKVP